MKNALDNATTNVVEITKTYLQNITENQHLNAFIEVFSDEALEQARLVDEKLASFSAGRLAGMVVGIKDNLCYKNHKVSASSKILDGFESLFTATSVQRLIDEDAIIIGRLNCDEFAMGSANENTIYGTVKNPLDNSKVAGGSSGGSAAAVSAGLCLVALGSDTGGSIRQPAAFCGIVGIKPTYSRVSRYGLIAYASSFDQIGPLTNNVSDAALILEVIAGKDNFDSTVSKKEVDNYSTAKFDNKSKKIAYISECLNRKGLDPEVKEFIKNKIDKLKSRNFLKIEDVFFFFIN